MNAINIFNEFIIVCAFSSALIISNYEFSEFTLIIWGWTLTTSVLISLVVTWISIIPEVVKEIRDMLFTKKKSKINKEHSIKEG